MSLKPCPKALADYLEKDLAELDKPNRKDQGRALEEVRESARRYFHVLLKQEDWKAVDGLEPAGGQDGN